VDLIGLKPETWFPVITLIAGAGLTGILAFMADRRKLFGEKEARKDQRLDAARIRRIEFQHATLLELQEAMAKLARFAGQTYIHDFIAFK
jgi:hypothetical protein